MQKEITSMLTKEIVRTIGIDVHSETYSISTYNPHSESFIGECTIEAEAKNVIKYVARLRKETAVPVSIEVGYEAGPTGFGLKRELEKAGIRCHVMAPTSIYRPAAGVRVKTDARDARSLARAVYWGSYSEVMPLSEEDEAYRDYIRMRDDRHEELKRAKQHLLSFLLRRGKQYQGKNYWTRMHMGWLKKIEFRNPVDQLTFKEYLNEVTRLMDAIELLDAKIEEFSKNERYAENVSKLRWKSETTADFHLLKRLLHILASHQESIQAARAQSRQGSRKQETLIAGEYYARVRIPSQSQIHIRSRNGCSQDRKARSPMLLHMQTGGRQG